jgi:hypothetical protein
MKRLAELFDTNAYYGRMRVRGRAAADASQTRSTRRRRSE